MSSAPPTMLGLFLERRREFHRRLKRRLGSEELANDVLQETYLRVERIDASGGTGVRHPLGYLFRMALNVAADHAQAEARYLTGEEVHELLHAGDDSLDPARVTQARFELGELERALAELSPRQRAILLAARVEEASQLEIARRHGISVRMVGKELRKALEHCGRRLERRVVQRFGPGAGKQS